MPHIPSLNTLRFFGALSVIFLHLGSKNYFKEMGLQNYHVLFSGNTGVQLFYVLSGFLITSLAIKEYQITNNFSFKDFFFRRALRLFPLYYLAILIVLILQIFSLTKVHPISYIFATTYMYNFIPRPFYHGLLGSFHTLATEEHFYLFFAILLAFLVKKGELWVKVGLPTLLIIGIFFLDPLRPLFTYFEKYFFVVRWTPFAIQPILIGCLGGILYKSNFVNQKVLQNKNIYYQFGMKLLLLLTSGFCFFIQVYKYNKILLSLSFLSFIFYLVIYNDSLISKILSWKPLVYLGTISYGLYVWQSIINGTGPAVRWIESPYLSTILVFVFSILSYEFYEKKFIRMKKRFKSMSQEFTP